MSRPEDQIPPSSVYCGFVVQRALRRVHNKSKVYPANIKHFDRGADDAAELVCAAFCITSLYNLRKPDCMSLPISD